MKSPLLPYVIFFVMASFGIEYVVSELLKGGYTVIAFWLSVLEVACGIAGGIALHDWIKDIRK